MSKIETVLNSQVYEVFSGDIKVFVYFHDGFIEIVDEDLEKKSFVFAGKDIPKKRELWLNILKVLETAIKLNPK